MCFDRRGELNLCPILLISIAKWPSSLRKLMYQIIVLNLYNQFEFSRHYFIFTDRSVRSLYDSASAQIWSKVWISQVPLELNTSLSNWLIKIWSVMEENSRREDSLFKKTKKSGKHHKIQKLKKSINLIFFSLIFFLSFLPEQNVLSF